MTAHAIAYLRRSSAPSTDTRTVSFEAQEAAVRDLAARHGDNLADVLTDWAKSGGTTRRPGYQQLLAAIDAGQVSAVYSYALSRLSRSLTDFVAFAERCLAHGVAIRLVQDIGFDYSTATGRGYAHVIASIAQMERELAQERTLAGKAEQRARGDHMGQAPYGYKVVAGQLVRREDEDPADVLAAFQDAGSFGRAARLLNERGVPTRRRGTAWNHGTVADIIRQQYPAEAPRALTRAGAKPRTGRLLAGLLACPCGSTLTPRDFGGTLTYYCSRSYRVPGHGKTTIREAALLPWVQTQAARFRVPVDAIERQRCDELRLAQLRARRSRVLDLYETGTVDRADLDRRLSRIDAEEAALAAEAALVDVPQGIDWSWPPDAVNRVLRAYFHSIPLGRDLLPAGEPNWRLPAEYVAPAA